MSSRFTPQIDDPAFAVAVGFIDRGEAAKLDQHLGQHPHLLEAVEKQADEAVTGYFAEPKLLWFVAENPIRNGTLPPDIVAVAETVARHLQELSLIHI